MNVEKQLKPTCNLHRLRRWMHGTVLLGLSVIAAAQDQRLADASTKEPGLAGAQSKASGSKVLEVVPQPNDIIFGARASGFENANSDTPADDREAARFLTQATFGPTVADMGELKSIGYTAWIDRQIALAPTLQRPTLESDLISQLGSNSVSIVITRAMRMERWFATAALASDQLRQRMGFAMSQIMVISDNDGLQNQPLSVAEYNDILIRNSLGSYQAMLKDVTYSPMMGQFLTTLRNQKTDWTLVSGTLTPGLITPDENYAREIMQLFSVGLIMRNRDFSPVQVGGQPVPTYTQDIITQTAKAFTGLTYSCSAAVNYGFTTLNHNCGCTGLACNFSTSAFFSNPQRYIINPGVSQVQTALYHPDLYRPMMCNPRYADTGRSQTAANNYAVLPAPNNTKLIIGGVSLPASTVACYSTTPAADQQTCVNYCTGQVDTVVNTLFAHQNVAPFIARQLIQRMVTSNPSAPYIDRVAAVFENDGTGARGNLGAVAKAILLDTEARSNTPATNFGKLREPLLRLTAIWRAFGVRIGSNGFYGLNFPERAYAQRPLGAPSVFNFYEPDFQQAGEIADANLFSPEFQIVDESTAISAADDLYARVFAGYATNVAASTAFAVPAGNAYLPPEEIDQLPNDNAQLIDTLNVRMLSGGMRAATRTKILNLLNTGLASTDKRRRALSAIHLIAMSPEFAVQR
jgi:uncharacterized protein (DUF1800 family)